MSTNTAISKTRNSGTPEHRNTEHQNTGTVKFRNTGTAKILNLVQILKSLAGGVYPSKITLSQFDRRTWTEVASATWM